MAPMCDDFVPELECVDSRQNSGIEKWSGKSVSHSVGNHFPTRWEIIFPLGGKSTFPITLPPFTGLVQYEAISLGDLIRKRALRQHSSASQNHRSAF